MPFYDSMIAKVITRSDSRISALNLLDQELSKCLIAGVDSNVTFLRSVLNDAVYREGRMTTDYVERVQDRLIDWCNQEEEAGVLVAAVALHLRSRLAFSAHTLWGEPGSNVLCNGSNFMVEETSQNSFKVSSSKVSGQVEGNFDFAAASPHSLVMTINGKKHQAEIRWDNNKHAINVWIDGKHYIFAFDLHHASGARTLHVDASDRTNVATARQ